MIPHVAKGTKPLEYSYIAGKMQKDATKWENNLVIFIKLNMH